MPQQLKFKKASADEVHSKRKTHVKDVAGGSAIVKGFKAPPSWNAEARSAKFIMSSETPDRYRDIVVQSGIDLTAFNKNPQGLLFHNSRSWPIGMWSDVTKILTGRPKRMEGVLNFLPEGTDEDADRAARHVAAGSMRTVSIGFIPDYDQVDWILDEDGDWTGGFRFNSSELIECSVVPVPAQPDALVKDTGGDWTLARDLIEDVLDTYTKTAEGLLIPLDLYEQKHAEMGGNRTSIIVDKALLPTVKEFVARDEMTIKATTDAEAQEFVGAKVTFDPAHPENKGCPFEDVLAKAVGEVIASWIVDSGENKGVHGFAVEFLTNDYSGMFRGIKAERFLLVKDADGDDEEETTDEETVEVDEEKTPDETSTEKSVAKVSLEVSVASDVAETQKQVEQLESAVDRVIGKIAKLFGGAKSYKDGGLVTSERKEPELTIEPEVKAADPTDEEIAAAKARVASIRERLVSKGMIAAE